MALPLRESPAPGLRAQFLTPPLPLAEVGRGGSAALPLGARGWGAETREDPKESGGGDPGRAWRAETRRGPGGQRVGPARVPSGEARTGRGYQAARPPPDLVPPPLPRFLAAPRPAPVCAAALGPGTAPPPHPREPRAAPGESEAPAGPGACRPRPTAPPPGPFLSPDSAPGGWHGTGARARPGVLPLPLSLAMVPAA